MPNHSLLAKIFLLPLSKLYGMGVSVRNKMFDWGILKEREFKIPVICVGNLSVGGTGKTPHSEYIIRLLSDKYQIGVLSRGYKRHTKGFVLASPTSSPRDIGDESYQMYHKFGRKVVVAVCEDRVKGIKKMLKLHPELNLIVLDDAFQHRYVKPKVSILLTEFNKPFFKDDILPYGRLRESIKSIHRADIVIATKCPGNLKALDYRIFAKEVDLIPAQDLFFSRYRYDGLRPVFIDSVDPSAPMPRLDQMGPDHVILALSGIGNPRPFVRYLKSFKTRVKVNVFPDHHAYSRKDMDMIRERFNSMPRGRRYIITTEKDAVRLLNNPYFPSEIKPYIFFVPIRVDFIKDDNSEFEASLNKFLNNRVL